MYFQRSTLRQVLATSTAYILNFEMGLAYAWASSNMKYLESKEGYGFSHEECTITASLLHIGRMCSPLVNLIITRQFGRKPSIILASLLMTISTVIVSAYKSVFPIYIARFMMGIGIGTYDGFGTIYIGEVASENIRGILLTLVIMFYSAGILVQYILAYYLTYHETSTITIVISALLLLSTYYLVESPYYLIENNQFDKASKIQSWLRACEEKDIEDQLRDIISMERVTSFSQFIHNFKHPEVYKSFIIVLGLGIVGSTLMTTTNFFANYIVPDTPQISADQFAMFLSSIPIINSLVSTFLVDRYSRRTLLIIGFMQLIVINTMIGVLFVFQEKFYFGIPYFSWIIFFLVILHLIVYSSATYPPILTLRSELFPASYKILGVNICIGLNGSTNFICTVFFMQVTQSYGMYLNYVVFTLVCGIGLILVYYLLPETRGKTLTEIQRILKGNPAQLQSSI